MESLSVIIKVCQCGKQCDHHRSLLSDTCWQPSQGEIAIGAVRGDGEMQRAGGSCLVCRAAHAAVAPPGSGVTSWREIYEKHLDLYDCSIWRGELESNNYYF